MAAGAPWVGLALGAGALAAAAGITLATRGGPPTPPGPDGPTATAPVAPSHPTTTPFTPRQPATRPRRYTPPPLTGPPPVIAFESGVHDFGRVMQGQNPNHVFRFRNGGKGALQIVDIKSHCGCLPIMRSPRTLAPGASGEIAVTLETAALLGRVSKIVEVFTNDPVHPITTLTVWVDARRPYTLKPESFVFGEVTHGTRVARVVELHQVDGKPFEIVELSGAPAGFTFRTLPLDPERPGVRRLELTITPEWTLAASRGRVFVRTDPATAAPLWILFRARAKLGLQWDPWQVRFGRVSKGQKPSQTVKLTAADGKPFTVTTVSVSPAGAVVVSQERDGPGWRLTISPGPRWPAQGRLSGAVRVKTDRFALEAVILIDAWQLAD